MTSTELPRDILRYGFRDGSVGIILAAVSDRGVASIFVGSDCLRLRSDLVTAFPESELIEDDAATTDTLRKIVEAIDDPRKPFDLSLDIRGSETQVAVWEALRAVPVGETRTYGQIAKTLSIAITAQDVGAACAANVLAVAIPCHRVTKADGSISGYRWGVARKRQLLQMEAAA